MGTTIVPICHSAKLSGKHLLLTLTYRIPVESWVLEFPGGLADGEGVAVCGARELKEETGYTGKIRDGYEKAFQTVTDPWKSNDTAAIVFADVNLDDKENENQKQKLDEDENIQTIILPLKNLKQEINKLRTEKKIMVSSNLWSFAEGLELSQSLLKI